jgi:hypothetical protein
MVYGILIMCLTHDRYIDIVKIFKKKKEKEKEKGFI